MNEEELKKLNELVHKIHDSLAGYEGIVRFEALLSVVAAGIVAYSDDETSEQSVYGGAVRDLAAHIDSHRKKRPYKKEADGE